MTYVIVPLAGPDYVTDGGFIKGLLPFQGDYLLNYVLKSRPWHSSKCFYIFILQDSPYTRAFAEQYLKPWFPKSSIIFLASLTKGAAFSVLAGLSIIHDFSSPIIVDLADIYFTCSYDPSSYLSLHPRCNAIGYSFTSTNSIYSFFECSDTSNCVLRTAEKICISDVASVGVYVFRNLSVLMSALCHSIQAFDLLALNNLLFIAPLFNHVISPFSEVHHLPVDNVIDIKS